MVMFMLALVAAYVASGLRVLLGIDVPFESLVRFLFAAGLVEMPIDLWLMSQNHEGGHHGNDW